jgi:hypothetical protein
LSLIPSLTSSVSQLIPKGALGNEKKITHCNQLDMERFSCKINKFSMSDRKPGHDDRAGLSLQADFLPDFWASGPAKKPNLIPFPVLPDTTCCPEQFIGCLLQNKPGKERG